MGLVGLLGLLAAVWTLLPGPIERDPPRTFPWPSPDYRTAETRWWILPDGRIRNEIQHVFLEGITPEMIAWFYRQLPIASVLLQGENYPLYHLFHATEHGRIRILEAASDGSEGMGLGALIEREEWFGPYDSRGRARLVEFSANGMLAIPEFAGLPIGSVRHDFKATTGGTLYTVEATIGSQIPLLGLLINRYLRERVFHPAMIEQWQRHQLEEVASLQFFLPQLYAQRAARYPFLLAAESLY